MIVSVIIPTYNCATYLEEAVRSVADQTFTDIEIIVVDDGSTDDTSQILARLKSLDRRVNVIRRAKPGGAASARNAGLRVARGEFVAFLDADDIYVRDKIEQQVEVFRNYPDIDIVFGNVARFDQSINEVTGFHVPEEGFVKIASAYLTPVSDYLYRCNNDFYNYMSIIETSISTISVMFKRDLLKGIEVYFLENIPVGEDIDLWFRLVRRGKVAYINETLAYYRSRPGSLTYDRAAAYKGFIDAHSRNLKRGIENFNNDEVRNYKRRIALNWDALGYHYFCKLEFKKARYSYYSSLRLIFKFGIFIRYLKACLPKQILKITLPIWRRKRYSKQKEGPDVER